MTFFCPNCWKEITADEQTCSRCGAAISSSDEQEFTVKLIRALSHPEPETRMRAVYLLGERRAHWALDALTQLYRNTDDLFLKREVITAVAKLQGEPVLRLLIEGSRHPSFIVRQEAEKALAKQPGNNSVSACGDSQSSR